MNSANSASLSSDMTGSSKTEAGLLKQVETLKKELDAAKQRAQTRYQTAQAVQHELRRSERAYQTLLGQYENKEQQSAIVYRAYEQKVAELQQKNQVTATGNDSANQRIQEECVAKIAEEKKRCHEKLNETRMQYETRLRELSSKYDQKVEATVKDLRQQVDEQKKALAEAKRSEQSAKDEATKIRVETEKHRVEGKQKDQEIQDLKMEIEKRSEELAIAAEKVRHVEAMSPRKNNRLQVPSQENSPQKPNTFPKHVQSRSAAGSSTDSFAGAGSHSMERLQTPGHEVTAPQISHMQLQQALLDRAAGKRSSSISTAVSPQPMSATPRQASTLGNTNQNMQAPNNGMLNINLYGGSMGGYSGTGLHASLPSTPVPSMSTRYTLPSTHMPQVPPFLSPQRLGSHLSSNSFSPKPPVVNSFHGENHQYPQNSRTTTTPMQSASTNWSASNVFNPGMITSNSATGSALSTQSQLTNSYMTPMTNVQSPSLQSQPGFSQTADTPHNLMEQTLAKITSGRARQNAQYLFACMKPEDGVNYSRAQCIRIMETVQPWTQEAQMKKLQMQQQSMPQHATAPQMGNRQIQQQTGLNANNGQSTNLTQASDASSSLQAQLQSYPVNPGSYATQSLNTATSHAMAQQSQPGRSAPPQPAGQYSGVACLECHRSWNNQWCDANEPCENCQSGFVECVRPQCEHADLPKSDCPKGTRCNRAHTEDGWTLAPFKKDVKRKGKSTDEHEVPAKKRRLEGGEGT